jgi:hypothetical protein
MVLGSGGWVTTFQLVPFHCSINVPLPLSPTAQTLLVETAATARRLALGTPPLDGG